MFSELLLLLKMKSNKLILTALLALSTIGTTLASDTDKKLFRGYEGGMMLHSGYLEGDLPPLAYHARGITKGIGGAVRLKLGNHWRVGTEGYTSSMKLLRNGSYIKTFWAGLLTGYTCTWGHFAPYLGVTIGGGTTTDFIMFAGNSSDWGHEEEAYYHKSPFIAIDPFIGCDYIVSDKMRLTLKVDYLKGVGQELYLPIGSRAYIGFLFCH